MLVNVQYLKKMTFANIWYSLSSIILGKSHNIGYYSFANMVVAFFNISFLILRHCISFCKDLNSLSVTISLSDILIGENCFI